MTRINSSSPEEFGKRDVVSETSSPVAERSNESVRAHFAKQFGEDQAIAVERAARDHGNGINDTKLGADPFKWAILICIGYECISKDSYRAYHGVTAPWPEIKQWIKDHGELASHDGDCDYLSMLSGAYDEFMPDAEVSAP